MIAKLISKIKTVVKTVTSPTYDRASFVSAYKWKIVTEKYKIKLSNSEIKVINASSPSHS